MSRQGEVHTKMREVRRQFARHMKEAAYDFKVRVADEKISLISTEDEMVICAPITQEETLSLDALFSGEVPLYLWYFSLSEKTVGEGFYLSWFDAKRRACVLRHQDGYTRYRRGSLSFRGTGTEQLPCAGTSGGGIAVGCCTVTVSDYIVTACLTIDLNGPDVDVDVNVDPID